MTTTGFKSRAHGARTARANRSGSSTSAPSAPRTKTTERITQGGGVSAISAELAGLPLSSTRAYTKSFERSSTKSTKRSGLEKLIQEVTAHDMCPACSGAGHIALVPCKRCLGSGLSIPSLLSIVDKQDAGRRKKAKRKGVAIHEEVGLILRRVFIDRKERIPRELGADSGLPEGTCESPDLGPVGDSGRDA